MINKSGYKKVKAEYELVYADKEPKASVLANTLEAPLQEVRVINEGNEFEDGWRNMLIFGDNLMALKTLYEDMKEGGKNSYNLRNKIKLIYIDPPFATRQDFMKDREKAYADKVAGAKFIEFLRKRLIFMREILADDGSIYVHLDWKKGHYIKAIMDEVFGEHNFMNEIVWYYGGASQKKTSFPCKHETVFYYAKHLHLHSHNVIYNKISSKYMERAQYDIDGRAWFDQNVGKISDVKFKKMLDEDRVYRTSTGEWRRKQYVDEMIGTLQNDVWDDITIVNSQAKERKITGEYPTQKPEKLLERIIKASSNENGIVLDCFAGSGTTLAVAEKLGRRWIGMDCGKLSVYTIQSRLLQLTSTIGSGQKDSRSFFERVENQKEALKSKGMLVISEKKELMLTDELLCNLHSVLKGIDGVDEFSITCPDNKLHLEDYIEDENGVKIVEREDITYKIYRVEPKEKYPKPTPLEAKAFNLYSAGVYDKDELLKLRWKEYKDFVMKLFEVRVNEHEINGFRVDGYIGVHSAYIWNYPEKENVAIDEDYVKELHEYLKGKAGERMYVIAPGQSINFMQDEVTIGSTIYTFLKVPASVLVRLIQKEQLGSFKQPKSEKDVNEVIDAFGFDFVSQPQVKYILHMRNEDGSALKKQYIVKITEFYADGLTYSPSDFKNFESLSLVLIDTSYESNSPFIMKKHLWGKDLIVNSCIEKGLMGKNDKQSADKIISNGKLSDVSIVLNAEDCLTEKVAIILIDMYGNEKNLVIDKKRFK